MRLVRRSSGGSWSEPESSLSSHGRRQSRSSAVATNRSVGSGNLDGFDWAVGLDNESGIGGILPYPSETESAVTSEPNTPSEGSLPPAPEENFAIVDPLPLVTPAAVRFGMCLLWNTVAACLAFISIDSLGPVGPLLFVTLILPPSVLGVGATWSIVVTFARYAASLDSGDERGDADGSRWWGQQQRRAMGKLMIKISQDPKRWGLVSCISSALLGLTCIFGGFTVGFWELKRLALAAFTTLVLIPFTASAALAGCYVTMGCIGCCLQCCRGRYSPTTCLHGVVGCIAGSTTVSTQPKRFALLAFQAIVLILVLVAACSAWSDPVQGWMGEVLLSFGMTAFLVPFVAYGIVVEYFFVMGCIGWVCRRMDNNTSAAAIDAVETGELPVSVGGDSVQSQVDESIVRIEIEGNV